MPSNSKEKQRASNVEPNTTTTTTTTDNVDTEHERAPVLPPDLLKKILQHFFEDEGTKISSAAVDTINEYTRVLMRETVWRAVAERRGGDVMAKNKAVGVMLEVSFSFVVGIEQIRLNKYIL